jgi:hypothetical protein
MHHLEVPVIAVFTKYDQFLHNVEMHLTDYPSEYPDSNVSELAEKQFQEHYLRPLGDDVRYVRLESGFKLRVKCPEYTDVPQKCKDKIHIAMILLRRQLQCWTTFLLHQYF